MAIPRDRTALVARYVKRQPIPSLSRFAGISSQNREKEKLIA